VFHHSDLLSLAKPAPWVAPSTEPAQALARRVRHRKLATQPADAPTLRLPDLKHLDLLVQAVERVGGYAPLAATLIGACLESPVLAYASPKLADGSHTWRRLAMLPDVGQAALLVVSGTPGRKGVRLSHAEMRVVELSDANGVRGMIEEVYIHGDRPHRDVRDRGRATPPRAVWLGLPSTGSSREFELRAAAIAAVDGYVLEFIGAVQSHTRNALARTADKAPELVLVWQPHVPPGDFAGRVSSVVSAARVVVVDDPAPAEALEQVRVWTTLCSVKQIEGTPPDQPGTMHETAVTARAECAHLEITDQAVKRARESPYEDPAAVLDALRQLDQIADDYADDRLGGGGFEEACGNRGLLYSKDISARARRDHRSDYVVRWDAQDRLMGPHLRFGGSWNPRYCARVYWWLDTPARRIIVGHIGVHLPGGDD